MSNLRDNIQSTLEGSFIETAFPVLTQQGVKDADVFMHSIGCSVWNTLGHELGYMAVAEGPAPKASGNDIRSDSIWFNKHDISPCVLIEFERYDGGNGGKAKLEQKLVNLMDASQRWDSQPNLLVLSAWSSGLVSAPDFTFLEELFRKGVSNSKGSYIPTPTSCYLLLHRMVFESDYGGFLHLKHMTFRWSQ